MREDPGKCLCLDQQKMSLVGFGDTVEHAYTGLVGTKESDRFIRVTVMSGDC